MLDIVKEGSIVKLYDYQLGEEVLFDIVPQTKKTHYIGGSRGAGNYRIISKRVLDTGGNGITSISLESLLGRAIKGMAVGQEVKYVTNKGDEERFRIIEIINEHSNDIEEHTKEFEINIFCNEVIKLYKKLEKEKKYNTLGIINHDEFQLRLLKLGEIYGFAAKKEIRVEFNKVEDSATKGGFIDVVYYQNGISVLAIEIDSGIKRTSVKKLVDFDAQYRVWFCYKKDLLQNIQKYKEVIDAFDPDNKVLYLLPEGLIYDKKEIFNPELISYTSTTTKGMTILGIQKQYEDSLLIWIKGSRAHSTSSAKYQYLLEFKGHKKKYFGEAGDVSERGAIIQGLKESIEHIVKPCRVVIISTLNLSFGSAYLGFGSYRRELCNISKELYKRKCVLVENYYVGNKSLFNNFIER